MIRKHCPTCDKELPIHAFQWLTSRSAINGASKDLDNTMVNCKKCRVKTYAKPDKVLQISTVRWL